MSDALTHPVAGPMVEQILQALTADMPGGDPDQDEEVTIAAMQGAAPLGRVIQMTADALPEGATKELVDFITGVASN